MLHHIESGPKDGPPLVFLHGFLGSAADWSAVIDRLSLARPTAGHRIVAIDLPGHGGSIGLPDHAYMWEGAIEALAATLDALDIDRCRMVGYSMGGRMALALALHRPRRIARLVVVGASAGLRSDDERRQRRDRDAGRAAEISTDLEAFVEQWYRQELFASLDRRPNLREALIATRSENDPREVARAIEAFSPGRMPDLWPSLDDVGAPTLVTAGCFDERYARLAYRMSAAGLPLMPLVLPNAGHLVHLENPRLLADVIADFCRDGFLQPRGELIKLAA